MYNAEDFIVDCLDSVLAQTFTDYEFIIVDDCSTDNSYTIVENYIPKFAGKLKLIHSEKNSTNPSTPRNIGIRLSQGEYICFLDSDDALTPTALEEIYNLTVKFKVDVIHCERYYLTPKEKFTTDKNLLEINAWQHMPCVEVPTFFTNDIAERLELFLKGEVAPYTWSHIVKRELLMRCNIFFPPMRIAGDNPYTLHLVCEAKTFLRVPNVIYVYRERVNSQSRCVLPMDKWVHHRVYSVFYGLSYLIKIMNDLEFFNTHPEYKFKAMDVFVSRQIYEIGAYYQAYPVDKMDPLIQRELEQIEDKNALTSFLFSRMSLLSALVEKFDATTKKMTKRISAQDSALEKHLEVIQTQAVRIKQLESQLAELK